MSTASGLPAGTKLLALLHATNGEPRARSRE
jgi:hypothetical protein